MPGTTIWQVGQLALDDVQIGAVDSARAHSQQNDIHRALTVKFAVCSID